MMQKVAVQKSIILFDGVCSFCNASVLFVIKHDAAATFQFAALQSAVGALQLKAFSASEMLHSLVLIENGKFYTESTAALRIAKKLDGVWSLLYAFIIIPAFARNWVYRFIAKNRYKWFGKQVNCVMPSDEMRNRFLN